uniref:Purinergic receptor P2X, ligand-gated ion channel, 4b n=1 Tax=Nothobranchius furzeri TaxID=105023 RepID=A0A8C6PYQ0_NOTFU
MSKPAGCFRSLLHYVFDYETPKTLVIPSLGVGFVYRFTQLLVVLYVLGTQTVISTVTTKVKGLAFTNTSDVEPRFWDAADMINPPQSDRSFIVLTNMVITPGQTQARCPEVRRIRTGLCENYSTTAKTCEVHSWCPLEIDSKLPQ